MGLFIRPQFSRIGSAWPQVVICATFDVVSQPPPARVLADALSLPAHDRLALAAELLDSVEGADDPEWDSAWLAELDSRAQSAAANPSELEDWALIRDRLLNELRSK